MQEELLPSYVLPISEAFFWIKVTLELAQSGASPLLASVDSLYSFTSRPRLHPLRIPQEITETYPVIHFEIVRHLSLHPVRHVCYAECCSKFLIVLKLPI
jgi:hypothetical protein